MTIEADTGTSQDAGTQATNDTAPARVDLDSEAGTVVEPVMPADTSIRASIKAATEEVEKREKSPARQAAAEKRARAGNGQFTAAELADQATAAAAKDKATPAPKAAAAAATTIPAADKSATSDPANASQGTAGDAPAALSREIKAAWATLPENVRQEFIRREADTQRGVEQLRSRYQPIEDVIAPVRPLLQQRGLNDAAAVKQLLDWHMALAGPNKVQAFQALARSHGVDISAFAPRDAGTANQTTEQDPLAPRLAPIMTQMQTLQQRFEAQEAQRQADADARTQAEIATFAKDKPHFGAVRETMGRLLASGIATDLNDAYDKATRFVPEVATAIAQEQEAKRAADAAKAAEAEKQKAAEAEAARQRTDAEHATKARTASSSVRGGPPTGSGKPQQKAQTVGETIREVWKEAAGGSRV